MRVSEEESTQGTNEDIITQDTPEVEERALTPAEEVTEKYDPSDDVMAKWLAMLTRSNYAARNPEVGIAARLIGRMYLKKVSPRRCPLMAVTIQRGRHILMYNEDWVKTVSFTEFKATIVHEAYHVMLRDIPRFFRRLSTFENEERRFAGKVLNVALDAANNSLMADRMPHLKYGSTGYWVLPEPLDLPGQESSELYFDILLGRARKLKDRIEEMQCQMPGMPGQGDPQDSDGDDDEDEGDGSSAGQDEESDESEDEKDGEGQGSGDEKEDDQDGQGQSSGQNNKGSGKNNNLSESDKALLDAVQELLNQSAHPWGPNENSKPGEDGDGDEAQYGSDIPQTPEALEALASELEEDANQKTVNAIQTHEKKHGSVPAHMQSILDAILEEGEIPWTTYLSQLVAAKISTEKYKTTKRFDKSQYILYEEDEDGHYIPLPSPLPRFPGIEVDRTYVIMWALDTSGSMSDDDIIDGLRELQGLIRTDPNVHVIVVQCDTNISDVSILSPDESLDKYVEEVGRTSRGGTSFRPPFQLAQYIRGEDAPILARESAAEQIAQKLHEYDGVDLIVYHTDGYAPAPPIKMRPPCPVLWCLTKNGSHVPRTNDGSELFGTVIER